MPYIVAFGLGMAAGWLANKYWVGIKEVFKPSKKPSEEA